ncbi:MAG: family 20 glycosylhydrolase, partial [Clostridia bacterium]|nr:family 20 glycosylhydrolase [Clostridia bacterium]
MAIKRLGTMIDCSRNAVMKKDAVKKWIDITAQMGYNCLMLYTEDTYEIKGQPYFGYLRGRYTQAELREMDAYAKEKGMELIPCIQTLAHLRSIFRWPVYDDVHDCHDILLLEEEKTYQLIDDMLRTCSECFESRTVNVGMDEAMFMGLGKYLKKHGYQNRTELLLRHVQKVAKIAEKYGQQL